MRIMTMIRTIPLVPFVPFVLLAAVGGCSSGYDQAWADATGQKRPASERVADQDACRLQANKLRHNVAERAIGIEHDAEDRKLDAMMIDCMMRSGWKPA